MVGDGFSSKEIANTLKVSAANIDKIILNLCYRYDCRNRKHLVKYAERNHLLTENVQ